MPLHPWICIGEDERRPALRKPALSVRSPDDLQVNGLPSTSRPGARAGSVDDATTARELPSCRSSCAVAATCSPRATRRAGTSDAFTSPACGAIPRPRLSEDPARRDPCAGSWPTCTRRDAAASLMNVFAEALYVFA